MKLHLPGHHNKLNTISSLMIHCHHRLLAAIQVGSGTPTLFLAVREQLHTKEGGVQTNMLFVMLTYYLIYYCYMQHTWFVQGQSSLISCESHLHCWAKILGECRQGLLATIAIMYSDLSLIFTPRTWARSKVVGYIIIVVVIAVIVNTKLAKSGDLGTWPSCKHNGYVEFGNKLASVCSKSSGTAYKHHKSCILAGHHSYVHRLCPLCIMHDIVPSAHAHDRLHTCR